MAKARSLVAQAVPLICDSSFPDLLQLGATVPRGRIDLALGLLNRAHRLDPRNSRGWRLEGAILLRLSKPKDAVGSLKRALGSDEDVKVYADLIVAHLALCQYDRCLAAFEKGKEVDGTYPRLYTNYARVLLQKNQVDEARKHYEAALAHDPEHPAALMGLGLVFAGASNHDAACRYYYKALIVFPGWAPGWLNYGRSLEGTGRLDEARDSYKKAIDLDPLFADACERMAEVLEALGSIQEASRMAARGKALRATDHFRPAERKLIEHFGGDDP